MKEKCYCFLYVSNLSVWFMLTKQLYDYEILKLYAVATSMTWILPLFHWVDFSEVSFLTWSPYEINWFKYYPTFLSNDWPKNDLWSNFSQSEIVFLKKSFDKSLLETKMIESLFPLGTPQRKQLRSPNNCFNYCLLHPAEWHRFFSIS